jgi:hypothetical protein
MNTIQKRFLLFLFGCIGTRSLLLYIAKNLSKQNLFYLGWLTLILAVGFMYIYLTGTRQTGAEVFGDKIWWNDLRPLHSLLYFVFSYNAIMGNMNAWIYLLVDVIIGLISFLSHHYMVGDFAKLV